MDGYLLTISSDCHADTLSMISLIFLYRKSLLTDKDADAVFNLLPEASGREALEEKSAIYPAQRMAFNMPTRYGVSTVISRKYAHGRGS